MRFSTVAFTLFGAAATTSASLVARQSSIPDCMIPCTLNADFGSCQPTDNLCLCQNQAFVSSTTKCVQSSCTGSDLQAALAFSTELCLKVGVTLSAPAAASTGSSASTGASASATNTATSPASSTTSSAAATQSTAAALSHGANTLAGLAAVGIVALAL